MPDIFVAPQEPMPKAKGAGELQPRKAQGEPFPLAALMVNPSGIHFQDQEEEEEIILLVRRHWVTNLPWILMGGLMFLVPFFISLFLPLVAPTFQIPLNFYLVAGSFWYLLSLGYLYLNFLIWYFNAHLVTNKRLVDIDFHNLTYKEVSSTSLERIQDVSFRVGGVIRHLFDYGDIFIQTAGTEPNFEFNAVPKPAFVADKLTDLMGGKKVVP